MTKIRAMLHRPRTGVARLNAADLRHLSWRPVLFVIVALSTAPSAAQILSAPQYWPVPGCNLPSGWSPVVADLNGDAYPDLLYGSGYTEVRLNLGGSGFAPPYILNLLGPAFAGTHLPIGVGDLNCDGLYDLVFSVMNSGRTVYYALATPGVPNTFVIGSLKASNFSAFGWVESAVSRDMDGDGVLELVCVVTDADDLSRRLRLADAGNRTDLARRRRP
jgi:hypothetical protein